MAILLLGVGAWVMIFGNLVPGAIIILGACIVARGRG